MNGIQNWSKKTEEIEINEIGEKRVNAFNKAVIQANCEHKKTYKAQKTFDILNGFEFSGVFCSECGKLIEMTIKAFGKPEKPERPKRLEL